jgi:hypothetical protein
MSRENVLRGWDRSKFRGFERACYASGVDDARHTGAPSVRMILDLALSLCRGVSFDRVLSAEVFCGSGLNRGFERKRFRSRRKISRAKRTLIVRGPASATSLLHSLARMAADSFGFAVQSYVEKRIQVPL